jgi:nitrogen fixation-related uncharacterized protein
MGTLLVIAILIGFAIASYLWGVDSRPGFSDGRTDYVEHWFPHER